MSFTDKIGSMFARGEHWVHSAPAFYAAGAHNIFAITGGIVLISNILEYLDTAMTNATETFILIGATPLDGGTVVINGGGVGAIVASPMDPLGVIAKVDSALAAQAPSILGFTGNINGILSGPGVNIIVTFGGVQMAAGNRYSLHVCYRRIHSNARISTI